METIYIVAEIKTVEHDGGYAVITNFFQFTNRNHAESKYHTVLAAAANINFPKHGAVLMTNDGFQINKQFYSQPGLDPDPKPEPEPEIA